MQLASVYLQFVTHDRNKAKKTPRLMDLKLFEERSIKKGPKKLVEDTKIGRLSSRSRQPSGYLCQFPGFESQLFGPGRRCGPHLDIGPGLEKIMADMRMKRHVEPPVGVKNADETSNVEAPPGRNLIQKRRENPSLRNAK